MPEISVFLVIFAGVVAEFRSPRWRKSVGPSELNIQNLPIFQQKLNSIHPFFLGNKIATFTWGDVMDKNNKELEYQKENNGKKENAEKQRNEQGKIVPRHEKLWVWQRAHKLMIIVFNLCKRLPHGERLRLGDQIQRSSKSVPDNIAEGCSSYYFNNKIKCYRDSRKEAAETQNHLREMESKTYITDSLAQKLIEEYEEVIRGLNGLINKTLELRELYERKGIKRI